jgi:hypothetical protein
MKGHLHRRGRSPLRGSFAGAIAGLVLLTAIVVVLPAAAQSDEGRQSTSELWELVPGTPPATHGDAEAVVRPDRFRAFTLDEEGLEDALAPAQGLRSRAAAAQALVLSLPAPGGGFERFSVEESPIMELELAAKHPEIKTYSGRGIDDPGATIRADVTPLGFHASVRSPKGAWYIDPYYHLDSSLYVTYFGRDLDDPHGTFVERELGEDEESNPLGLDLAAADVPEGPLVTLRTYRLALLTDPTYSNFFGGPANVTAAKVTLMNRVNQVYEDETAIRLVLVGNNDLLNLNTPAQMTGANGPCGAAPCYTPALATSCGGATLQRTRIVIGQIIGATNYDVGHIGLGNPGGGVASLGVVGGNSKAQGCTGLSTPVGDFFAVDYVAHEMGHQFAGNHTFNGTQSNCSGGNRNAANSVEPGSGSSIMAYAGICQQDNLQPHSDPYWSQRSFQEITAYVTSVRPPINEVQTASLRDFGVGDEIQTVALSSFGGTDSFQLQFEGNTSVSIVRGTNYSADGIKAAIEGIAGWPAGATVTVSAIGGASPTPTDAGFDVTFGGTLAATDVSILAVVNTVGCTASVFEANDGGPTADSFTLRYEGTDSAPIVAGTNYTTAGIQAALQGILPVGATATVAAFGGTGALNATGFQVTFGGTLGLVDVSSLALTNLTGTSGFVGETAKGGPIDNQGFVVTETDNHAPVVDALQSYTIPLRTPFALTGSATDFDGDTLTYMWEQNDRGGISGGSTAGTALVNNTKTNGPLFRQFGTAADVSPTDTLLYNSPGLNAVTTDPTRVFPDLGQIAAGLTNAVTGTCPAGPAPPTPLPPAVRECFSEFLPTADYVGFLNDRTLHFRLTVRDGNPGAGGVASGDMSLALAPTAGPFLVTSHGSPGAIAGSSTQTVTWDVAGTDLPPVSTTNVKISLSVDGGLTYPHVLSESTANDGSEAVVVPNVATTKARIKVEAVGNVFFDVSDADVTIQAVPVLTTTDRTVQYSDGIAPAVVVSATDDDSPGSALTASASGLPAGLTLAVVSTSADDVRPGTRSWTLAGNVTAAPGVYPVSVTVSDDTGGSSTASFTVTVTQENAAPTYVGDALAFAGAGGSATVLLRATVRDSAIVSGSGDTAPGDIRNATVTFKEGGTTLCGPVPVELLNGALTSGAASCTATLGLGAHDVDVEVGSYYVGGGEALVEIVTPDDAPGPAESRVLGDGNLVVGTAGGGVYAPDAGTRLRFHIDVKFTTAEGPTRYVDFEFVADGRRYQVTSERIDSLGARAGIADLRATVELTDITKRNQPVVVASGLTLRVTATDAATDSIGLTLWNGNRLFLASRWTGFSTLEQALAGGRIDVR